MEYNYREIEPKWQEYWKKEGVYRAENGGEKPSCYVLDMFPYPSGAGLHVGHPLGYIASDIYSRYKRQKGFNVLHPMGYDAYGLPAEQYAIQTGTHPAVTTQKNIARYREQLDKIGFGFDWSREVRTCDPKYYKWTQWTFIQLFNHYYDVRLCQARPISELVGRLERGDEAMSDGREWGSLSDRERQEYLMGYRLAYLADIPVNWCEALGTVLANDEVVNGVSVRGGYPVERRLMRQWSLRISAYGDRLLKGLEGLEWPESLKEIQRNWIGRSEGATVWFPVVGKDKKFEIFTTRPDTIFGVTFMVLCPEHEMIESLVTEERRSEVERYVAWAKGRSERERQSEVKKVSGVFTGAYARNPLTGEEVPIWVSEYVLGGYGTGAIMAVPAHDSRDFAFARHFDLPIRQVVVADGDEPSDPATWKESMDAKSGHSVNSDFVTGMVVKEAMRAVIEKLEQEHLGRRTVNYRLRDAIFSRQRYWGEPFPVYYKDGMPYMLPVEALPLELPEVADFKPSEGGQPPLANAPLWAWDEKSQKVVDKALVDGKQVFPLELCTMPGFAGSSGYYLRYMDPWNDEAYFSKESVSYWKQVDLYVGGAEHGTGHLIYARFWCKFLYDIGLAAKDEPFAKLINQGMIQGRSNFVYRSKEDPNLFLSKNVPGREERTVPIHVDINLVDNDILDIERFKAWRPEFADARFELEDGRYVCGWEVEKMSKSMYNVQNPDDLVERYGADTLRLYEMFLGPVEQAKPWDTKGIEGVHRFLKKFWKLYDAVDETDPSASAKKTLNATLKKVGEDIERFSFNTAVSTFMICVNELTGEGCHSRTLLEPLAVVMAPFAPHIAEELWHRMGHTESVCLAQWPSYDESCLVEECFNYPVSFNGKMRFTIQLPLGIGAEEALAAVASTEGGQRYLAGATPKRVVFVPKKIINIVI